MKRLITILVCMVFPLLFVGCGMTKVEEKEVAQTTQIGNPWSSWSSVAEAEQTVGFTFGLPEVIADTYVAEDIRTMNKELIEVIYRDGDCEVRIRKQNGEGQDISGDYNQYDSCTEETIDGATIISYSNSNNNSVKQLVSYNGFSWSLVAADGYWGDSNWDLVSGILEQ